MADSPRETDPHRVRESRLRYYQEADKRKKQEEIGRVGGDQGRRSDQRETRSRDDKASSRIRSHESHSHSRSSNRRDKQTAPTHDFGKGKRRQDSPERVVVRRTILEEPRGSFIAERLQDPRTPPAVRRTNARDPVAGPSRWEPPSAHVGRGVSVQERSDRNVAVAAGIAQSVRTSGTTKTKDRSARRKSSRSPGKERDVAERYLRTRVASSSVAPLVTTSDAKKRIAKPPPPSVLGTIFGAPSPVAKQPKALVTCLTCADDGTPRSKAAKLACSHYMCHDCLKRLFTMSVTDPAHMPPKCCQAEQIPLKHVEKLFDTKFKDKWNKKYKEYATKNRLYCPVRGCGKWIKPASIATDSHGRKYGKCSRCKNKVCATCNGKYHVSKDCPKDEATKAFAEMAKKEGWRRCTNCTAMIERKSGCNHITCRCNAEFCILCGAKWKTCNCPQFNDEVIEQLRQDELRNPFGAGFALPPEFGRVPGAGLPFREQVRRQNDRERRHQEHADAEMARRVHAMQFLDEGQDPRADAGALGAALTDTLARPTPRQYEPPRMPPAYALPLPAYRENPGPPRHHHATRASERHVSDHEARSQASRSRAPRAERVVMRREAGDYRIEAERHRPIAVRASHANLRGGRRTRARATAATMAGLRKKSSDGRVGEWVMHVEEGEGPGPDEDWEEEPLRGGVR